MVHIVRGFYGIPFVHILLKLRSHLQRGCSILIIFLRIIKLNIRKRRLYTYRYLHCRRNDILLFPGFHCQIINTCILNADIITDRPAVFHRYRIRIFRDRLKIAVVNRELSTTEKAELILVQDIFVGCFIAVHIF